MPKILDEQAIEEAAYKYGNKINTHVGDQNFIAGAKSEAAKQYWQRGMYSEEDMQDFALFVYNINSEKKIGLNPIKHLFFEDWAEHNKKKNA